MTAEPISWTDLALACWPLWVAYLVLLVVVLAETRVHR